jgi:hypothetical protein
MFPVAEAETVVVRRAAEIDDDAKNNEARDCNDLNGGEDELCFAISTFRKRL